MYLKNILSVVFLLLFTSASYAQKIKFKKDMIQVDKKDKYEFLKTKDGSILGSDLPNFVLKDLNGNELLNFTDTTVYYAKLDNEKEQRVAYRMFICNSPMLNKRSTFPIPPTFNFRKYITGNLEDLDFFKTNEFTEKVYQSLLYKQDFNSIDKWTNHIDTTNTNRLAYSKMTSEIFSPLKERVPGQISVKSGVIYDGRTKLGKFSLDKKGSYAHIYYVVNHKGFTIGIVSMEQKSGKANFGSYAIDESGMTRKNFFFQRNSAGQELTPDKKLTQIANHIILSGLL